MNFHRFEQLCRDAWPAWDTHAIRSVRAPEQRHLRTLAAQVEGMATENKMLLLNLAVSCLEDDEVYVEIGCWKGKSLVGAMQGNAGARAFACDNFSEFGGPREQLSANLRTHVPNASIQFRDADFRSFLDSREWQPNKVGVYFYDGGHSFVEQYEAIERMVPSLSKNALVIVDDTNLRRARRADDFFAARLNGMSLYKRIPTSFNGQDTWWNGLDILRYSGPEDAPPPSRPALYGLERVGWDEIGPRLDHAKERAFLAVGRAPGGRYLKSAYRLLKGFASRRSTDADR